MATSFWKPGRTVSPDPERPRSSSITLMEEKPAALAASTRAYCRLWLSRLPTTCAMVDWRIYTTAARPRWSGAIFGFIGCLHRYGFGLSAWGRLSEGPEEKVGQRLEERRLLCRHGGRFRLGREAQRELGGVGSCRSSHTGSPA